MSERIYKEFAVVEVKELRDEFAIAALIGLANNFECFSPLSQIPSQIAQSAYEIADAMMKIRTKKKGDEDTSPPRS